MIADLEAGVGTLSRLPSNGVDTLIVVAEPSLKSIEVAQKILDGAISRHEETTIVIAANKMTGASDLALMEESLAHQKVVIPLDRHVTDTDRTGEAPIDSGLDSPAVAAISELADLLETSPTVAAVP